MDGQEPEGGMADVVSEEASQVGILLVDDRPENLLALEAVLAPLHQNLVKADSGGEALRRVLTQDFGLILMDLHMPDMDGFETAQLIRGRDRSKDTPIIFLTTEGDAGKDMARGYSLGGVDFIVRPFVPQILLWKARVFVDLYLQRLKLKRQARQLSDEIAQRKRLYRQLEIERAESLRNKDEFLAHAAHELRTPLGAALQFVTILAEGQAGSINEEQKQFLEIVTRNLKHMRAMISDLTDASRALVGKLVLKQERTDIKVLIDNVAANSRPRAAMRDISITVGPNGEIPPVYADNTRVTEVLTNLVDNAIKFAPSGSVVHLGVSAEVGDSGHVVVTVHDQGTSLTPEMAEHVFDRLYQGAQVASESRTGLGLGLFISKQIVNAHGGRIWVDLDPDGGPTFLFTLPPYDLEEVFRSIVARDDWPESPYALLLVATTSSADDRIPELELPAIRAQVRAVVQQCIRPDSDLVLPMLAGIPDDVLPVICKVDVHGASAITVRIEEGLSRDGAKIGPRASPRVILVGEIPRAGGAGADVRPAAKEAARWLENSIISHHLDEES